MRYLYGQNIYMSKNIYMDRERFIKYMELIKKEADMYNQIISILQNNNRDVVDLLLMSRTPVTLVMRGSIGLDMIGLKNFVKNSTQK